MSPLPNLVFFQPRVQSQAGRYRLTQTLRALERLKDNSTQAADAVRNAAAKLTAVLKKKSVVENADFEQLRMCYHVLEDVLRQQWRITSIDSKTRGLHLMSPQVAEKHALREVMSSRRLEVIASDQEWINKHRKLALRNLVKGCDLNPERIEPYLELCETNENKSLFRYLRYTWSSPYSEYVGRRMRFLIRDRGHGGAVIGIAALGSSIMQISDRDKWIGWLSDDEEFAARTKHWAAMRERRAERIVAMMDMYVCGSIPPYSHLLGGKLVCYMMMSNEVRDLFRKKYGARRTITLGRKINDLALLVTTSLYGDNSSQYNRIKYDGKLLYKPIGLTRGYGTVHLSSQTFEMMRRFLSKSGNEPSHKFGDGVNWKMRVIRSTLHALGLDQDLLLQHSYPKAIYASEYAQNSREYLTGKTKKLLYYDRPLAKLIDHWRERWLSIRLDNKDVMERVKSTNPQSLLV